jgi:YbbR domain-containing protein
VVKKVISLLKSIFIDNWLKKFISLILAIIVWFVVDQSLTSTKTINTIGVRVINLPQGKTINGLQPSGLLSKRFSVTITGKKSYLEEISPNDLEIVIDGSDFASENIVNIQKKHLVSLNPELSISNHINKVNAKTLVINLVPFANEKIPVYVSHPIGEPPKGFQFLDVWPYHLNMSVSGPDEIIKKLKTRGLKLTFNLNDISKADLERVTSARQKKVVSFFIPEEWKTINLPSISDIPLKIDDPEAKYLRIDFIRSDIIPINFPLPVSIYFPPDYKGTNSPSHISIGNCELITSQKGLKILNKQLYTKGVSELFVKIIKDMIFLSVNMTPGSDEENLDWSIQFINPTVLEDRYVSTMITEINDDELKDMHPTLREEHLRNRFRNYMHRFSLFYADDEPFEISAQLKGKEIILKELSPNRPNV